MLYFDEKRLTPQKLEQYTAAIRQRDAPIQNCWGFIDGTLRKIARPIYQQEAVYNGWKRYHCLKYQAIVTPDGLISHLYGPVPGIQHDSLLWQESGMQQVIEQYCNTHEGIPMQIYGDPAYKAISLHILSPFDGSSITRQQAK